MATAKKEFYQKIPKSFDGQIQLLKSRGLIIENPAKAKWILSFVSYNRLSNYWFPLLHEPKDDELFKVGSTFETAFKFYQFDSDLRAITFQAIEQIEIALRTQIIYHFSNQYKSGFWFQNPDVFKSYPHFVHFLSKITKNVQDSKQEFITKYHRKYEQFMPPSWKSFELLTFNSLLFLLKNLKDYKDIIPISKSFGLNHSLLISWMECFVYIRNICAHHSRLWNIKLTISPQWPKSPQKPWVDRWENLDSNKNTKDKVLKFYAGICSIIYCLEHINPYNGYGKSILDLIKKYPEIDLNYLGFPENWGEQPLWLSLADR